MNLQVFLIQHGTRKKPPHLLLSLFTIKNIYKFTTCNIMKNTNYLLLFIINVIQHSSYLYIYCSSFLLELIMLFYI
jgi:hypothetical protein